MRAQGKLKNYTPGKATDEEMFDVLSFASQYYKQKYSGKEER